MNKIYLIGIGMLALAGAFYMGMSYQASKVTISALKEDKRELKDLGDIKAGNVKHEQEVKESVERIEKASDPTGCSNIDMPDSTILELGGVHSSSPSGK